ncbi:hypothetical protein [Streptomyces ziwulingensis]|uniref:Uncharacterized protein n=1 Tax=Streptomyces ziwulingensis TaxID=1045501 RepID=A0ABP9D038_9ACTN
MADAFEAMHALGTAFLFWLGLLALTTTLALYEHLAPLEAPSARLGASHPSSDLLGAGGSPRASQGPCGASLNHSSVNPERNPMISTAQWVTIRDLVAWLDHAAAQLAANTHPTWQDVIGRHALAVARAINGTAS